MSGFQRSENTDIELSSGYSNSPSSSYDSVIETQDMSLFSHDQFEGIFYRTKISESKISISFVSKVFFDIFKNKIHSDFQQSVEIDETSFISKCTTHVKGAKCELRLDSHFRTVELLGIGFKVWRAESFPRIAQSLFKRLMEEIDSRLEEESTGVSISEDLSEPCPQSDLSEPCPQPNLSEPCPQPDLSEPCPEPDLSEPCSQPDLSEPCSQPDLSEPCSQPERSTELPIKAEPIRISTQGHFVSDGQEETESQNLIQNLNIGMPDPIPTSGQKEFTAELLPCAFVSSRNADMMLRRENQQRPVHELTSEFLSKRTADGEKTVSNGDKMILPNYTSTPILQRQCGTTIQGTVLASDTVYNIINRIDQLDSSIKAMKRDIILTMERELTDLKASLVNMAENTGTVRNFSDVVKSPSQVSHAQQLQRVVSDCSTIDEGYGNNSRNCTDRSATQPKTLLVPDDQVRDRRSSTSTVPQPGQIQNFQTESQPVSVSQSVEHSRGSFSTPQPVPVHITNRNLQNRQGADCRKQSFVPHRNEVANTEPTRNINPRNPNRPTHKRTLLVGDSLFKEINPRGIKNGVRINSRNGGMIKHVWDEIDFYDLKSFANIVLCIGGNDASSRTNTETFEQKYDEIIGNIKAANSECVIYLCNVVPRGDIDVTAINSSIERIAGLWRLHQVKSIKSTNEFFFDSNGLPRGRYFSSDGIHLSSSGTKRLVDAISRHVDIVHDIHSCVFKNRRYQHGQGRKSMNNAKPYGGMNRNPYFNGQWKNQRLCYACSMPGHDIADCFFAQ